MAPSCHNCVRDGAGSASHALASEKICGALTEQPFADDKVCFLVSEVDNIWQWLSAFPPGAPDGVTARA